MDECSAMSLNNTVYVLSHIVHRVTPDLLQSIKLPDCFCMAFSLPKLPSTVIPPGEPVDVAVSQSSKGMPTILN